MNCFEALGVEPGNAICYSGFRKGQRPGAIYPSYNEIKEDLSLPRSAFQDSINKFLFKTPIDLVFTSREPERKFVSELVKKENAQKLTSWLKSKNQN